MARHSRKTWAISPIRTARKTASPRPTAPCERFHRTVKLLATSLPPRRTSGIFALKQAHAHDRCHAPRRSARALDPRSHARQALDRAVADVQAQKADWPQVSVAERRALLEELRRSFLPVAERWAAAASAAEGLDPGLAPDRRRGLMGPLLRAAQPAPARPLARGDRAPRPAAHPGPGADPARRPGRRRASSPSTSGTGSSTPASPPRSGWSPASPPRACPRPRRSPTTRRDRPGGVALVLGAGNVSSIGPMDALYKLFVEDRVVLYKVHPVNAYLGAAARRGLPAARRARLLPPGPRRRRGGGLPLPAPGDRRDPHHRLGPHLRGDRLRPGAEGGAQARDGRCSASRSPPSSAT